MTEKAWRKHVVMISLLLTILIFSFSIVISYGMDFIRIDQITNTIENYRLSTDSYLVETEFMDTFGGDRCDIMNKRVKELKEEVEEVGDDLSKYGQKSFFNKKDFDYLKRKYFLLELRLYNWINEVNNVCNDEYSAILFFYKINDDASEREGYILTDLAEEYEDEVFVFSFDIDYEDEPLLDLIKSEFNITKAPTMIINGDIRLEGQKYLGELRQFVEKNNQENNQDIFLRDPDSGYTLDANKVNISDFTWDLENISKENISDFAKGDIYLILGRLNKDMEMICRSAGYFRNSTSKKDKKESAALAYETLASLNCNGKKKKDYLAASKIWKELGNHFRSGIDRKLAEGEELRIYYDIEELEIEDDPAEWDSVILGNSSFIIDDEDIIVSQTDRVSRDWLSQQISQGPFGEEILSVFSEREYLDEDELFEDIGWHEGGRIKELKESGAKHLVASGTLVKKIKGEWYAPDEKGIFRFDVPKDKVYYPTTRFLKEDLAVIIDTHGVNMLVEQAIRNDADVVVGCGDNPGKVKAARYLSDKGVKVITFPDKYGGYLLGSGADVYGSPPIEETDKGIRIGGREIEIEKEDKVVVMNISSEKFASSYYKTPSIYFRNLEKMINISPYYATVNDTGKMGKVIEKAEDIGAGIIAVRVYSSDDYDNVRSWLEKDRENKAILFHSMPYPYGYKLFKEFPDQTSFGDINPVIT